MTTREIVDILEPLLVMDVLTSEEKVALKLALDIVEEHQSPGWPKEN